MTHKRRLERLEAKHATRGYVSPFTDAERLELFRGIIERALARRNSNKPPLETTEEWAAGNQKLQKALEQVRCMNQTATP